MSILTKEERELWKIDAQRSRGQIRPWKCAEMLRALDTIDALEAERDAALRLARVSEAALVACEALLEAHFGIPIDFENGDPYVRFDDGTEFRGCEAIAYFQLMKNRVEYEKI